MEQPLLFSLDTKPLTVESEDEQEVEVEESGEAGEIILPEKGSIASVMSDEDISARFKHFNHIAQFLPWVELKEDIQNGNFCGCDIYRVWAQENLIDPLFQPQEYFGVQEWTEQKCIDSLSAIPEKKFKQFARFYAKTIEDDSLMYSVFLKIGIELSTRMSILRLGRNRPSGHRKWVGRAPQAGSPRKMFSSNMVDLAEAGRQFVICFIGPKYREPWELLYRGGLWKIVSSCEQIPEIFIEEYEEKHE